MISGTNAFSSCLAESQSEYVVISSSSAVNCSLLLEDKMIEIGSEVAKKFKYVRVDFYDVDGKLYFGEITLHHGSGLDSFIPESYDEYYGKKLIL